MKLIQGNDWTPEGDSFYGLLLSVLESAFFEVTQSGADIEEAYRIARIALFDAKESANDKGVIGHESKQRD